MLDVLILVVVDDGLVRLAPKLLQFAGVVLILVVVDDGLVLSKALYDITKDLKVLILVVVDDGLVLDLIRHY